MNEPATILSDDGTALLLAFLRGRDVDCPACGYNLRDLNVPRCPECAEQLTLRVQPTEPNIRWPVAGLIALSAGGGFSAMMSVFFLIAAFVHGHMQRRDWELFGTYCFAPAVLYSVIVIFWLRSWRKIRRLPHAMRVRLVGLTYVLPLVHIIMFSLKVK